MKKYQVQTSSQNSLVFSWLMPGHAANYNSLESLQERLPEHYSTEQYQLIYSQQLFCWQTPGRPLIIISWWGINSNLRGNCLLFLKEELSVTAKLPLLQCTGWKRWWQGRHSLDPPLQLGRWSWAMCFPPIGKIVRWKSNIWWTEK